MKRYLACAFVALVAFPLAGCNQDSESSPAVPSTSLIDLHGHEHAVTSVTRDASGIAFDVDGSHFAAHVEASGELVVAGPNESYTIAPGEDADTTKWSWEGDEGTTTLVDGGPGTTLDELRARVASGSVTDDVVAPFDVLLPAVSFAAGEAAGSARVERAIERFAATLASDHRPPPKTELLIDPIWDEGSCDTSCSVTGPHGDYCSVSCNGVPWWGKSSCANCNSVPDGTVWCGCMNF